MQAYGFSRIDGKEYKECGHVYENNSKFRVDFDNTRFSLYNNDGVGVCNSVALTYGSVGASDGAATSVNLSSDFPTDLTDRVYGANAVSEDNKIYATYSV